MNPNAAPTALVPSRSLDVLALRAQQKLPGSEDALIEALLLKLRPLVSYRVFTSGQGALTRSDVDDLLQDIVILIWQRDLPLFDPAKSGFLTFVNRRIQWHLADRARAARRNAGKEIDDVELHSVVDVGRDPESLLQASSREHLMQTWDKVIACAPTDADARVVLRRHDLEGATLMEVAKELDMHVSNACRARKRGLKHLARHLEALI